MNILWITNTIFPAPSEAMGIAKPVIGGWMYGLAEQVSASPGMHLAVATTYSGKEIKTFDINGVLYYLLPVKSKIKPQKNLGAMWNRICEEFKPDVVHIHGTEHSHGLECMRACAELRYVVSIQGMHSGYARYSSGGISTRDILTNITFRDVIRGDIIFQKKTQREKKALYERECLQRTRHIIGRTSWDYAHVKNINPAANYHYCNECLRDDFYSADK
jgi:hypothetical protein